jgi:hypothetical protein
MKKILFFSILLSLIFSLYPEIVNPDKPLQGDWDLKAEKVWEISRYGKKPMAAPALKCVLEDGTICIYDWKRNLHYALDSNGKLITPFGKRGEGPGEVRWASSYFSANDKFIIYDRPKLHYFLKNGKYEKSVPIGGSFDPPIFFINENEYISRPKSEGSNIALVNLETGKQKVIKKTPAFSDLLNLSSGKHVIGISIPWSFPDFQLGLDGKNKRLYYGISHSYLINIVDLNGNMMGGFSLKREKKKITKKMEKEYAKRNPGEARMMSPAMRKRIPKELNYFSKIQTENGLVYVFVTNYADHWDDQQVDIFSPEGKYLYRTIFIPGKGEKIYSSSISHGVMIKNGFLYTVLEDSNDDRKLVKYKVSLPAPNPGA